jgi:ornithine carbamoyltransferase
MFLLDLSARFKRSPFEMHTALQHQTVILYFNRPSTRTRLSMETAVARLGGVPATVGTKDLQLGRGETVEDTAKVVSRYARAFVVRSSDDDVQKLAKAASIPVINALSEKHHPCQSVADLLTIREAKGRLDRLRIVYVGDGNNVTHSLMEAVAMAGATVVAATPETHVPDPDVVDTARALAAETGARVEVVHDPIAAARGADVLYTDTWLSMSDPDSEREARLKALAPYRLDAALMSHAKPDCIAMHCLPAHRGEEITDEMMDGPRSVVFDQSENRLHTACAILYALVEGKLDGRA